MKQLVFMTAATLLGTVGVFQVTPFLGPFVYYLFAVLRPQYMWKWSLPDGISWSFYVAIASIAACLLGWPRTRADAHQASIPARVGRLNAAHRCVFYFAIWIAVSFALARHRDVAYPTFEEYVKIFIMYFVSAALVRSTSHVWALYVMTAMVLAYIAYEINYLYLVNGYLGIQKNGYGGLDNNGAGLMLAMGMPLCWFCYEGLTRWWRVGFLLLIPVIVHAVLMTYSRGAMLSLIVGCPVLLLRSRLRLQLLIGIVVFAVGLLPVLAGPEIRSRFFSVQDSEVDESAISRRKSWGAAWKMALDNPLFGVGVRNSNLFAYEYGADVEGRTIHSQYLQIAADNGLVGLALYLSVFAMAFACLCRTRALARELPDIVGRRITAAGSGIECSLVVYAFGAMFLSLEVFELPYLLLFLAAQLQGVAQIEQGDTLAEVYHEFEPLANSTFPVASSVVGGGTHNA